VHLASSTDINFVFATERHYQPLQDKEQVWPTMKLL